MKFAIIGLGKMGSALSLNALEKGLDVVAYNRSRENISELQAQSSKLIARNYNVKLKATKLGTLASANTIEEVVNNLTPPRTVFLMVSAGKAVDEVIRKLVISGLAKGDIVVDGGNSFYKDSVRRFKDLKIRGVHFLDMGTSGGIEGARYGACFMVGGEFVAYKKVEPILKALSVSNGYAYVGKEGAGHFVKMVHNGIEYGMLQAIGEGFEVLKKGPYRLDLAKISNIYRHGSVIRGWLMDLAYRALKKDTGLGKTQGKVGGGETGSWILNEAKKIKVDMPALTASLKARKKSQKEPTFAGKVISKLRWEFGRHDT